MREVLRLLQTHLGSPPEKFVFKKKEFSPRAYAKEVLGFNRDDYAMVSSLQVVGGGPQLIGSSRTLVKLAEESLRAGTPVWIAADIRRDNDVTSGILHPGIFDRRKIYSSSSHEVRGPKHRRWRAQLKVSSGNHAMILTGFDQPDPAKPVVKFKVENSWGTDSGDHGIYHMYRAWFLEHVYEVIVPKRLLSPAQLKKLSQWEESSTDEDDS